MSTPRLLILAAIAGFTIFLGLPVGKLRNPALKLRATLNAGAIGVLVFLLFDILSHANEPVEGALTAAADGAGSWSRFAGLAAVFAGGVAIGLIGLVYVDKRFSGGRNSGDDSPRAHRQLAWMIAIGIGLHNFSEGLAIGQSAAAGEISLAVLLIIGFGLHNATEGFGIVSPMAGDLERPSWRLLGAMGLVGGGPTLLGTILGRSFVNDVLFIAFLALAAGSIIYVLFQLIRVVARQGHPEVVMWGVFVGLVVGFATDYVLVAAGG